MLKVTIFMQNYTDYLVDIKYMAKLTEKESRNVL